MYAAIVINLDQTIPLSSGKQVLKGVAGLQYKNKLLHVKHQE